ncbi:MAG TPA: ester cyclase [Anaerolineae bacterium]
MPESIEQFITEFIAAWNAHDIDRVTSCYCPEYEEEDVAQPTPASGRDDLRRRVAYYLRAFPDLRVSLDDVVVEGNRIVLFWTWHGTHQATFMRIPPTGRTVAVRGTSLIHLEDGKIRRALRVWDLAGLLRGIGLLPEL